MTDVYKRSVTKTVFVWICIVLMIIGWLISIFQTKNKTILNTTKNGISKAISGTTKFLAKSGIPIFEISYILNNYGGYLIFLSSWLLFVIFEITWNPYKDLKNVDNDEIEKLVE